MKVFARAFALLRPSGPEVLKLVRAEMDPARAAAFEQLCFGPLLSALALIAVVLLGALIAPARLIARLLGPNR